MDKVGTDVVLIASKYFTYTKKIIYENFQLQ
jgi:hypothetical protein